MTSNLVAGAGVVSSALSLEAVFASSWLQVCRKWQQLVQSRVLFRITRMRLPVIRAGDFVRQLLFAEKAFCVPATFLADDRVNMASFSQMMPE
ncbi:MAG: hypothetical protein IPO00_00150 [Betaproteobacteria bacterium]|nr:hypothetical protein [Betaproteobacteria bacterium]